MQVPENLIRKALLILCAALTSTLVAVADEYAEPRALMMQLIRKDVVLTGSMTGRPALNERVLQALANVPRHEFVPPSLREYAYENRPLPIGHGQTISQPYIVALMSDLAELQADDTVLEIGTGSGYQAAILGELVQSVFTIEIIAPLAEQAKRRLAGLGYGNIRTRLGDGYYGWPARAPFDAILVTAAADHVPPPLIEQLRPGGRLVIPVGGRFLTQQLLVVEKREDGTVRTRQVLPVRFVPLTGER